MATITELKSAKWFDPVTLGVDDQTLGLWGEKTGKGEAVKTGIVSVDGRLKKLSDMYAACDPDLVVTVWHATEKDLQVRYSTGDIRRKTGSCI